METDALNMLKCEKTHTFRSYDLLLSQEKREAKTWYMLEEVARI